MTNNIKLSKFLSLILRHQPDIIGIKLDRNGFANVTELIDGINKTNKKIDFKLLEEIVQTDAKQRYSFNYDKTKIRANQGHSIDVDLDLKEIVPPCYLYHGTAKLFINDIYKLGIVKKSRNYVHLSADIETAKKVGERHGIPVVLKILSKGMYNDGYKFYLAENGVWLTDYVPNKYITSI